MGDLIERAEAAMRRLDGAAALALYSMPDAAPDDQVRAGRVRARWLLRDWPGAREESAELTRLYPESAHAAIARGVIALGQPDEPGVIGVGVGSALRDNSAALAAFIEARHRDHGSPLAVAGLADALRMSGRTDDAATLLDERIAEVGPSPDLLIARAACEFDRDHLDLARITLDQATEADPTDIRAMVLRISLDLIDGNALPKRAAELDQLITDMVVPIANLLELRGWIAAERAVAVTGGEQEAHLAIAMAAFEEANIVGPAGPGVFCGLATVAELRGDRALALHYAKRGLDNEPLSPQLKLKFAQLVSDNHGPADDRVTWYSDILKSDPRLIDARIGLAYALHDLNRSAEARNLLAAVIEELPDRRDLIKATAWLDIRDGNTERALAGFRRLARADTDVVVGEVRALRQLGAIEQAEALCEQVFDSQPGRPQVALRLEYAFCAMHESRYQHAHDRATAVLAEDPDATEALSLQVTTAKRLKSLRRSPSKDDRTAEVAKAGHSRSRLREEIIPAPVRERTLARDGLDRGPENAAPGCSNRSRWPPTT